MIGEVIFNKAFRPYLSENPDHTLVLRGGHVQRYELIADPKQGAPVYIDKDRWLANSQPETNAFDHLKARIVYQEVAPLDNWRRIIATYLPAGHICGHTISYLAGIKYDPQAFLAIFNSRVVEWRFRLVSMTNHVSSYQVAAIPFPRIAFTTPAAERQRHAAEGRRLHEQFCATHGDVAPVRGFVAGHLDAGRSDVVHDLLAHLAEQMIAMHKEKQGHQRTFRLDLAGYLDEKQLGKLGRLYTPKKPPPENDKSYAQKLAAYEQAVGLAQAQLGPLAGETLNLDDFWRLNQAQWMWLLKQNLGPVANMSELVAVYEKHRAPLAPLMRRIQRTDWLIDQVVYQLYGLTDEEIAVVEGRL
jgi:hypothetical protein